MKYLKLKLALFAVIYPVGLIIAYLMASFMKLQWIDPLEQHARAHILLWLVLTVMILFCTPYVDIYKEGRR